ncbi:non-homologous end-joining DNA ligase [Sinorhizobium fredii]|uniref:non-homologous end-joining DNA ligase n=1 Tax=Rhizobium fredii TaxID=380 RepID=UPI0004AE9FB4|nr:non-homologous end-joining DNA ligase [Sinorhizobium fredii]
MALEVYRQKRNFGSTPEPKGRKARRSGSSFVVQKHDAIRLHYDFRMEMDGVLKSWAVTKSPSFIPGEKRLAVHVEDHPLEYGDFEGTIPKGEYGGGTVILWDRGTWAPIGDADRGYAKGHLDFEINGEKLGERWHLVLTAGKPRQKRENWLLIKGDDEAARSEDAPDILEERPESVLTGREIKDVEGEEPVWSSKTGRIRKKARATTKATSEQEERQAATNVPDAARIKGAMAALLPDFVEPALATLVSSAPAGERWLHEIKSDGYRLQARIEAGRVKLLTRSGRDWTKKFGKTLVSALQALPVGTALIDGEIVVETSSGASDFSALQTASSEGRSDRFRFYVFDLLHLDGYDLRSLPLTPKPARRTVELTHPDRLYWPDEGVTKEGLADYYAEIWRFTAPHIVGRPLALVRCPNGIAGEQFFQKHAWKGLNPNIVLVNDPKEPPDEQLLSIRDLDGLAALVQSAVLEIHPWGSTIADWERPDTIIMDLDPGQDVPFEAVSGAALETADRLKGAGLEPFVKTSGGKGLHVVAPFKPKAEWPAVKAFTKSIADAMASDSPHRFVSTITKSKGHGKILVDHLRNQRGATAVAAYSTRARPGAGVSMTLSWDELAPGIGPAYFTVENTPTRFASLSTDPWRDFHAAAVPLPEPKSRRRKAS